MAVLTSFSIFVMATATTPPATYHLCSYQVRTGEQEYSVYEFRQNITREEYTRELLEFCLQTQSRSLNEVPQCLELIKDRGFSEWAYDDRIYESPWVQDVTEHEYRILQRYLI